ncbi:Insect cuticle protein [Popillia japonica]|uniref:Insect cuticle protein n=1 Tax=Popillia japonica TaxID=7064 RepID=A0AAW1L910_POPJA
MYELVLKVVLCGFVNVGVSGLKSGDFLPPNLGPGVGFTYTLPPTTFTTPTTTASSPGPSQNVDALVRQNSQRNPVESFKNRPSIDANSKLNVDGIIRQTSQSNPDESYEYSYEAANGIQVEERGLRSNLQDSPIISSGTFKYTAPDNSLVAVKYVANENGFQPEGPHLPTPPPIPSQIIRALEWSAAHPEPATQ